MDAEGKSVLPHIQDVPAFLKRLRQLKGESGLTLRQLEERATAVGDYLPRSTLSHMLSGRRLPRPELLAAFVRACGNEKDLAVWLSTREAVAKRAAEGAGGDGAGGAGADGAGAGGGGGSVVEGGSVVGGGSGDASAPGSGTALVRLRGHLRRARVLVPAAVVVLLAATAGVLSTRDDEPGTRPDHTTPAGDAAGESSEGTGAGPAHAAEDVPRGAVRLRPVTARGLCLTDGKVRDKRYGSQVAVQRPCDQTAPQTTELPPASGTARHRVQWDHPEFGTGCLKILTTGPGKDLLEPWDACDRADVFRLAPAKGRNVYALRTEDGRCVGIARPVTAEGSEAVAQPCTPSRHQLFRIESAAD
ncbi:helix-turn-helix domain-containing protein [Streptomyces sp. NBC_01795]|uniref:helix-turn-helix domain-containing protein n=1 Tax=unclassified Streptomyces TaxID=2593676 RepID=UPI002DDC6A77|nr:MULTISPECIES: helix-turn-helix transcriptional regulator [unclassified Streptomyces]WSA95408.1 helix-turn-helix domain-containing protein [Streptomyces sp. NBC_01795]WSB79825.1 helix-turn-helix domain-containing protein [Streptomyces sp. NBC_01775]